MVQQGRLDRSNRVTRPKQGSWGSTSQDLLFVASRLFCLSKHESPRFVYAGIPLLLAAIHTFAIEYEALLNLELVGAELSTDSLARIMQVRYGVSGVLLRELEDLIEIRNEIIHPVPLPSGTPDNWPDYLRRVKEKGLLTTTGNPDADYCMFAQMASHKLFAWAVEVTKALYEAIVYSNPERTSLFRRFLDENFNTLFG